MFEHVGGEADVYRAVPYRQRTSVAADVADRPQIHRHIPSARSAESRREEPRPASDVQHPQASDGSVPPHERHRVGRQRFVEGSRVRLLAPAGAHQAHGAPHPEVPPSR
nr:hypothetical protein [Catenulispora acidiphila]